MASVPAFFCPYCGKDKSANEVTGEHVLSRSMGGNLRPTNPFKLRVCRTCNTFCGDEVDGPAASGFLGQLARSSVAESTDSGELTLRIVPIGPLEGWTDDGVICDLWLGPAGNNLFHFHRPYPGGNVMIRGAVSARKKKGGLDPGVVLIGVVPTNPSWFPLIVRSVNATFPGARAYVLNARTAEAPPPEFDRHVAWIASLPRELNCTPSINPHSGERFAAKLALGMGSLFLGEAFQRSPDADAFRTFIRGGNVPLRGLPPFAPHRRDRAPVVEMFAWRRCHSMFLLPVGSALSLVAVLYGSEPLSIPITDDGRLWQGKIRDGGLAWIVAPGLRRFVGPSSVAEMLTDMRRPEPTGPLAPLDAMLKAQVPLPPLHLAVG
jgi:hypothetical protein